MPCLIFSISAGSYLNTKTSAHRQQAKYMHIAHELLEHEQFRRRTVCEAYLVSDKQRHLHAVFERLVNFKISQAKFKRFQIFITLDWSCLICPPSAIAKSLDIVYLISGYITYLRQNRGMKHMPKIIFETEYEWPNEVSP